MPRTAPRLRPQWLALPVASRLAVVLWAALLVGVAVRVAVLKPTSQTVVPIYLAAGERWLAAGDLYALDTGLDVYRNPPGFAAAFAALTPLPPKLAGVLWRGLGAGVFLLGLWRFRRDVVPELSPGRAGVMFAVAAVLALPSVNNGQVNTLIAGAALNGVAAAARGGWWAAAGWFALGGWLKLYPFAVGMLACVAAPGRLAPRLAAAAVIAFALPFALHDPAYVAEQYGNFVAYLGLDDRTYSSPDRVPRDWTILPRAWLGLVPFPATAKAVSLAAAAGMAGLVWWACRRGDDLRHVLPLVLLLGITWMTVFGPATESNTYALAAGAVGFVVAATRSHAATALAWSGFVLLAAPIARAMFPQDWTLHGLGPQPIGVALALGSFLVDRSGRLPRRGRVVESGVGRSLRPNVGQPDAESEVLTG